jgi:hypothetical protein
LQFKLLPLPYVATRLAGSPGKAFFWCQQHCCYKGENAQTIDFEKLSTFVPSEQSEPTTKHCSMKNPAIKYGLLGGAVVVFYFALLYFTGQNLFLSPLLQWGSMVFYLLFMWLVAKEDNDAHGSARDFRERVRAPFVAFLLINLAYWLFYYGLHLYDPSLLQTEMTAELNWLQSQLSAGLGDPEQASKFRERIQDLQRLLQAPQPQPLGPVLTRMCVGALGGFGLAAGVVVVRSLRH